MILDDLDHDSSHTTADQHQHVKGKVLRVGEGHGLLCIWGENTLWKL